MLFSPRRITLCIKHISVALREAADSGAPLRRERGVVRRAKGVSAHGFLVGGAVVMMGVDRRCRLRSDGKYRVNNNRRSTSISHGFGATYKDG